jgi:hypothetical protein
MGNANPRLQHEACDAAHGQKSPRTGLVHQYECAIKDIEPPTLDEDERDALLEGDGR